MTGSLPEKLSQDIILYILNNGLKAGDKLPNEAGLAQILGAGRSSVREAVKLLTSRNVVEIRRGDGTYVSPKHGVAEDPLGLTFVPDKYRLAHDLLNIRFMLDPPIAASAAENADEADVAELRRLCAEVEDKIRRGEDHAQADIDFHACIAMSSKNLVAPRLIPILHSAIALLIDVTDRSLLAETVEAHRQITDAIAGHRAVDAHDAMYLHLVQNRRRVPPAGTGYPGGQAGGTIPPDPH